MLIGNPIYDTVFKYFLEDTKLAKLFLGLLLEVTILELEIQPQEVPLTVSNPEKEDKPISLLRLDFKATIKDEHGNRKLVLIELQKSRNAEDLFRFRNYLGSQYLNKENSFLENGELFPLPIISIYFIGFSLPLYKNIPVLKVEKTYRDISTKEILEGKIPFIETLSHDMILVHLPALQKRRRFEIEKILSIFDSRAGVYLEIDEVEYPEAYRGFLERLSTVMKKAEVVKDLVYEEMLSNRLRKDYELAKKYKEEAEEAKAEAEEAKAEAEEAKAKAEEAKNKAEEALINAKVKINQQKMAILNLQRKGMSMAEIASVFGITEEGVSKILSQVE